MSEDLRDLVGDDLPEPELDRLRDVDALLRSTLPGPEVPADVVEATRARYIEAYERITGRDW